MEKSIYDLMQDHIEVAKLFIEKNEETVTEITKVMINSVKKGGKVLWCGNGGSAADAQHLAAELLGRFKKERRALPSIALTTDTSVLTAIGNDYGYQYVFSRQVEGLVSKGDVLVGISTSGNSENVILAVRKAKSLGAITVGFLGRQGGKLKSECDLSIIVPSEEIARIQEMHIMTGHVVCEMIEREFV